ncbi:hypothetical protein BJ546DRAFT_650612 [Cryomyces antarcticus]
MTKIFALGATGYIGGDALYEIAHAHPEYEITCLVRNSDKGAQVASQYPKIKLVYGDLDSAELITGESAKADIVCNWANADHVAASNAIAQGLLTHSSINPAYWIHTSGTGILLFSDLQRKVFGEASAHVYDDWDGIGEVTSLPDTAPHRNVDKIVLATGAGDNAAKVKTAIVCPPTIYGPGRGPGNRRSHQVPELARTTLERGQGFKVGKGETYWTSVHVHDLSRVYLSLVEAAAAGGAPATWGAEGYYFAENGDFVWGAVSELVATSAAKQGFIKDDTVVSVSPEEADTFTTWGSALWGANSRARAVRARKLFGWEPRAKALEEEVGETVRVEAQKLGLAKGHAKVAAGEA